MPVDMKLVRVPRHRTILPKDVRYFVCNGYQLSKTGECLGKGATIKLGPIVKLHYDHQVQDVAEFIMKGRQYYVIIDEIQLAGLREKLEKITGRPPLAVITP